MKKKGVYLVALTIIMLLCLILTSTRAGNYVTGEATFQSMDMNITVKHNPPTITAHYPLNLNLSTSGNDTLSFVITAQEPAPEGTLPNIFWHVDGNLYSATNSNYSSFSYQFGCGISGWHIVRVVAADPNYYDVNTALQWNISVSASACPAAKVGGGGGGAAAGCFEKLACENFGLCYNLEKSLKAGIISGGDYRNIKKECSANNLDEQSCGFQIRACSDLNNCNPAVSKIIEFKECSLSLVTGCNDGIKNCHDHSCELSIDCGGPCAPCPTCSDKIKNQGEEGMDCGGPCPWACPAKEEALQTAKPSINYLLWLILLSSAIFIAVKSVKVVNLQMKERNIRISYLILAVALIIVIVFYYYFSRFSVGDFVYRKDTKNLIGEIKNTSIFLNPVIQWQDGRYSREYLFSVGRINNLNEQEISNILQENNEQELSLYSWTNKGTAAFPEMQIKTVEDLRNYAVRTGEEGCGPSFICGKWSSCQVDYNFEKMMDGALASGESYRYCKDYNNCMSDFVYSKACEIKEQITIKTQPEKKNYWELYSLGGKLVASITKKYQEGIEKLDIRIVI